MSYFSLLNSFRRKLRSKRNFGGQNFENRWNTRNLEVSRKLWSVMNVEDMVTLLLISCRYWEDKTIDESDMVRDGFGEKAWSFPSSKRGDGTWHGFLRVKNHFQIHMNTGKWTICIKLGGRLPRLQLGPKLKTNSFNYYVIFNTRWLISPRLCENRVILLAWKQIIRPSIQLWLAS